MDMEMEGEAVPALAVVDARFCLAEQAALAVAKTLSVSGNDFTVTDAATGAVLLRVGGAVFSLRRRCLLADALRRPVLTVQESVSPIHPSLVLSPPSKLGGFNGFVRAGDGDEHAVEGVPRGQHAAAGPAVHGGEAVGDPAAVVDKGQRVPRQQRRRAGLRLPDHRQLPRRRLLRHPRRLRHRHRKGQARTTQLASYSFVWNLGAQSISVGGFRPRQIDRRFTVVSALLGKNTYSVTVNPGIDYAFVVALAVVLDEMHYQ